MVRSICEALPDYVLGAVSKGRVGSGRRMPGVSSGILVLRYRRIRADELTDTAAGEGARATRTRVDS
jgi:hypothetical protein